METMRQCEQNGSFADGCRRHDVLDPVQLLHVVDVEHHLAQKRDHAIFFKKSMKRSRQEGWRFPCERETIMERRVH